MLPAYQTACARSQGEHASQAVAPRQAKTRNVCTVIHFTDIFLLCTESLRGLTTNPRAQKRLSKQIIWYIPLMSGIASSTAAPKSCINFEELRLLTINTILVQGVADPRAPAQGCQRSRWRPDFPSPSPLPRQNTSCASVALRSSRQTRLRRPGLYPPGT